MQLIDEWITPFVAVSIAYLVSFFLTFSVFFPIQEAAVGGSLFYVNFLFLPHGVRLLAAYFFGWKSVVLLAPAALITHYYLFGWSGFEAPTIYSNFVGISCAAISLQLLKWGGFDVRGDDAISLSWRYLLYAGVLASVINSVGSSYFYNGYLTVKLVPEVFTYLIGDISGQFFLMMILMLGFRWLRIKESAS